jgi:hypothetical protein
MNSLNWFPVFAGKMIEIVVASIRNAMTGPLINHLGILENWCCVSEFL